MTDQFLFRSKVREVSEQELVQGEEFADWLLREHDAYFSSENMVWFDSDDGLKSALGPSAIEAVYTVTTK